MQVGFCIKTTNKPDKTKVFVNVCSAEEVEKPSSKGAAWQLPIMAGKPRFEKDKKGDLCLTMDIVFHPNTLHLSSAKAAFKQMVAQSAIERAQDLMVRFGTGDAAKLQLDSEDFKILKQKACMGGTPAVIRIPKSHQKPQAPAASKASSTAQSSKSSTTPASAAAAPAASQPPSKKAAAKAAPQPTYLEAGEECPKVRITERGAFDLSSTMPVPGVSGGGGTGAPRRPTEIVVRVELPQCKNAKGVQLDVAARALTLIKPGAYRLLHHPLPYTVDADAAGAKFDKSTRTLEVILPVVPPPAAAAPVAAVPTSSPAAEPEAPPPSMEEAPPKSTDARGTGEVKHDRWVADAAVGSALDAETAAAVKAAASAPPPTAAAAPAPAAATAARWKCRYGADSSTILIQVPHINEATVVASVEPSGSGAPAVLRATFEAQVDPEQLEEHIAAAGGVDNMVLRHIPRSEAPACGFAAALALPGPVSGATFDVVELNMVIVLQHGTPWTSGVADAPADTPHSPTAAAVPVVRSDIAGGAPKQRAPPTKAQEAVAAVSPSTPSEAAPQPEIVLEVNDSGEFDTAAAPAPAAAAAAPTPAAAAAAAAGSPAAPASPAPAAAADTPGSSGRRRRGGRRGGTATALELE